MTQFQRALLGTIVGVALVFALLYATRQQAPAQAGGSGGPQGAFGGPLGAFGGGAPAPGIAAAGEATVKVSPDIAILSIGVTTQAKTAAEAQTALSDRITRVLQRAKDLKIADKDTKNSGYSIYPQYASGPEKAPTITGYQANQTLTITLRDVNGVGKALDTFVQGDAATNVQIRFALDDAKPKQAEARAQAIADARAKAKAMADAAGVRLGKVTSVSESPSGPGPYFDAAPFPLRGAAGGGATVPAGELDVIVRVQVLFAIDG